MYLSYLQILTILTTIIRNFIVLKYVTIVKHRANSHYHEISLVRDHGNLANSEQTIEIDYCIDLSTRHVKRITSSPRKQFIATEHGQNCSTSGSFADANWVAILSPVGSHYSSVKVRRTQHAQN